MAEEAYRDDLEKTEEPTPKRQEEARRKGQFAKSKYLIPAATLVAMALALQWGGEELMQRLGRCLVGFFSIAGSMKTLNPDDLFRLTTETGLLFAPVLLPFFSGVVLFALGSGFLQTGFVLAAEPLHFDLRRVNPVTGFRRLFSLDSAAELIKALVFIIGLSLVGGLYLYGDLPALITLSGFAAADIFSFASREAALLTAWVMGAMGVVAGLDYLFQRWRTHSKLKMSRQEVKEEIREQEGDPQLKGHLKTLRQKMSRRRMAAEVAKADVVITNPTELAVALRYRASEMAAPRVVGKGAGYVAQKIREIAREKSIPIIENRPLARLLYRQVEVGREIPETLYRTVAEVLAYIYRLRRGERNMTRASADRV